MSDDRTPENQLRVQLAALTDALEHVNVALADHLEEPEVLATVNVPVVLAGKDIRLTSTVTLHVREDRVDIPNRAQQVESLLTQFHEHRQSHESRS